MNLFATRAAALPKKLRGLVLSSVWLIGACTSQSEGQRCDQNADCQEGLACMCQQNDPLPLCRPIEALNTATPCRGPATDSGPGEDAGSSSDSMSDVAVDEGSTGEEDGGSD